MRDGALQAFGEKANKKLAADKAKLPHTPVVTGLCNYYMISKKEIP